MTLSRKTIAYLRWQLLEWHLAWWKASDWKKVWKTEILLEKYFYIYLKGLSMLEVYRYVCNICLYKNTDNRWNKDTYCSNNPRFASPRFTSPRFTSPRFTSLRFTILVQSSPVCEIPYAKNVYEIDSFDKFSLTQSQNNC